MITPAANRQRIPTCSQDVALDSNTFTSNSGPVSEYFVSGKLTGKERDPETGLYYYGARYLDPQTSRWISADPAMWEGDYIPGPGRGPSDLGGMGGIFNYVNFHVYHYAGNNPVKLVDPDGKQSRITPTLQEQLNSDISLVPGAGIGGGSAGGSTGLVLGVGSAILAGTVSMVALNISKAALEELSRSRTITENHHSFPVFLSGTRDHNTLPMERSRHVNLHRDLRSFLRQYYPDMEPTLSNPGIVIRSKHSLEQRKEAMARFYLMNSDVYPAAANHFFINNPETLNENNIDWANKNTGLGLQVERFALRLITPPTEE